MSITPIQIPFQTPTFPCSNPFDLSAWTSFMDEFRTFLQTPTYQQVIKQCTQANGLRCEQSGACPNLLNNPLAVFINPSCTQCLTSGVCSSYQPQMQKLACVVNQFYQFGSTHDVNSMTPAQLVPFVLNLINTCCGTHFNVQNVDTKQVMAIAQLLTTNTSSVVNNSSPSSSSDDSHSWFKTHWWMLLICFVAVVIVLGLLAKWMKKGKLSRQSTVVRK